MCMTVLYIYILILYFNSFGRFQLRDFGLILGLVWTYCIYDKFFTDYFRSTLSTTISQMNHTHINLALMLYRVAQK